MAAKKQKKVTAMDMRKRSQVAAVKKQDESLKPKVPAERKQIEVFGDEEKPRGFRASPRILGPGGQVEDRGSHQPLNNTFGPDFQRLMASRSLTFREGHMVAREIAYRDGFTHRVNELMRPDFILGARKTARPMDVGTSEEEMIKSPPPSPMEGSWGSLRDKWSD